MSCFDDASGTIEDQRNDVVLVTLGIAALAVFVFLAIVELAHLACLALQERIWREEIKADRGNPGQTFPPAG
jgi:hypothetical protein